MKRETLWFGRNRDGVDVVDVIHRALIRNGYEHDGGNKPTYTLENLKTGFVDRRARIVWRPWIGWGIKIYHLE